MFAVEKDEMPDLQKLFRYDDEKNAFLVDISIDYYKDLYNDWDFSPFKRRDLDDNLVLFIEESSEEIPLKYKVIINLFLPFEMKDEAKEIKSKAGLKNYFKYKLYKVEREKEKYRLRAFKYALMGILLVLIAFLMQKYIQQRIFLSVLPEGFFVGGWVFMWEVFTILFFQNSDRNVKIKEYTRLIEADINYVYYEGSNYSENI